MSAPRGHGRTPTVDVVETDRADLVRRVYAMLAEGTAASAIAAALPGRTGPVPLDADPSPALEDGRRGVTAEEFDAYLREMARRRILERARAGRDHAIRRGRLMHRPVYGYRHHPWRRGVQIVAPEEAVAVRAVFLMAEAGLAPIAIAAVLTSQGHPSPAGARALADGGPLEADRWTVRDVRTILRRPLYIGLNVMGRRRRDGTYRSPPIIGEVPHLRIVVSDMVPVTVAALLRAL